MNLDLVLIALHTAANVFWIGAIVAVALILLSDVGDAKTRGELAKAAYLKVATPAFVASLLFGLVRFGMGISDYKSQPWMHIKLTLAVVIIALHHVIGAKAKKMASGDATDPGKTGMLATILGICAVVIVFLVITKVP